MENKRGQVTIFIIIAIIIVALAALFYVLSPRLGIDLTPTAKNPQEFIETCIEEDIEDVVEIISLQGGSLEPEFYFTYNNISIEYLCYTNENYGECDIQQPLLQSNIENEIKNSVQDLIDSCFNSLRQNYEEQGYSVNIQAGIVDAKLLPERIVTNINYDLILTKDGSEEYKEFNVVLNNNLYELISIANSIIEWEANILLYGDVDVTFYMALYSDLQVEKNPRADGTKIYIITDRNTGNKFQFASRSGVLLPGF